MRIRSLPLRILGVCTLGWVLAGCGNDGENIIQRLQSIAGDIPQQSGRTVGAITANLSPTPGTVNIGGVNTNVSVPLGVQVNIPDNTPMAIISAGAQPVSGDFSVGTGAVAVGPTRAALTTNTGITVNGTGVLTQTVALPIDPVGGTNYAIGFPQGNVQSRVLTVGSIIFEGRFYFAGGFFISPIPIKLRGSLPNNGENAEGSYMIVNWGAGNDGRRARLRVTYGNGFVLDQTRTIANRTAAFADFATDTSNVPNNGVQLVEFLIGDIP